jgi:UDP-N-acetyl-D-glucosamine dehydrogenase
MAPTCLTQRLACAQAAIGVVGLGYVGLPLLLAFAERGLHTVGVDIDVDKISALKAGRSYIHHIPQERVAQALARGRLQATDNFAALSACDAIVLCVPTPLGEHREPDMACIRRACHQVAAHLQPGQLVVLESTSYPGTTREVVLRALQADGRHEAGVDFHLAFSPERQNPGHPAFALADIPKVVGGLTPACCEAAAALYATIVHKVVPVSSLEAAEMTKLLENVFRSVNIALVNEMKVLGQAMDLNIWEIIDAAATKPFGFMPFYPGPGLGGHCIPVDPHYLAWRARAFEQPMRFIELAGEIHLRMPQHVVDRLAWALNAHAKAVRNSRILIVGVAYKKDVDDMRESPALRIMALLKTHGAQLDYHDPFVPRLPSACTYTSTPTSLPLGAEMLTQFDAAVIVADHTGVDYAQIVAHTPLTIDTRNATHDVTRHRSRIVAA